MDYASNITLCLLFSLSFSLFVHWCDCCLCFISTNQALWSKPSPLQMALWAEWNIMTLSTTHEQQSHGLHGVGFLWIILNKIQWYGSILPWVSYILKKIRENQICSIIIHSLMCFKSFFAFNNLFQEFYIQCVSKLLCKRWLFPTYSQMHLL